MKKSSRQYLANKIELPAFDDPLFPLFGAMYVLGIQSACVIIVTRGEKMWPVLLISDICFLAVFMALAGVGLGHRGFSLAIGNGSVV